MQIALLPRGFASIDGQLAPKALRACLLSIRGCDKRGLKALAGIANLRWAEGG